MSGNGAPIPNQPVVKLFLGDHPAIDLSAGSGGGCVVSGPFKDYQLHLGPAALSLPGGNMSTVDNPLTYNPRCLKRSLTAEILQRYNTYLKIMDLILDNDSIWDFQITMQGIPGSGSIGVHGGGHYSRGGDPSRDVYMSPGDVAIWHRYLSEQPPLAHHHAGYRRRRRACQRWPYRHARPDEHQRRTFLLCLYLIRPGNTQCGLLKATVNKDC